VDELAEQLAIASGKALVSAMASRSWEDARAAMIKLWRRVHEGRIPQLESDLDKLHDDMLNARARKDADQEEELTDIWSVRFGRLISKNPDLIPDLRALLDKQLIPALPPGERAELRNTVINARASGKSKLIIAGGDLHISGS
jgi:hypothetical protein